MKNFDFTKVKKVMDFLNWEWIINGERKVPSIYEIIKFAEKEIWHAINKTFESKERLTTRCGGFRVDIEWVHDECGINIAFELTHWFERTEREFLI